MSNEYCRPKLANLVGYMLSRILSNLCQTNIVVRTYVRRILSNLCRTNENVMPSAVILQSVVYEALDKQLFCRVPDGMHSANILALGKSAVSGSAHSFQNVHLCS